LPQKEPSAIESEIPHLHKSTIYDKWNFALREPLHGAERRSYTRNSFVRQTNLTNVYGRIDYISNPQRQEHLYATYSTVEPEFWKELAAQNRFEYQKYQRKGTCIEARELVISLPESFVKLDPEKLLMAFTEKFRQEYGMQCTSALHHNKTKTNYHIHLIYSERSVLD
jgi:hypothetical protein